MYTIKSKKPTVQTVSEQQAQSGTGQKKQIGTPKKMTELNTKGLGYYDCFLVTVKRVFKQYNDTKCQCYTFDTIALYCPMFEPFHPPLVSIYCLSKKIKERKFLRYYIFT